MLRAIVLLLAMITLAACGGPAPAATPIITAPAATPIATPPIVGAPTRAPTLPPLSSLEIVFHKSGGIAGVNETTTIHADGTIVAGTQTRRANGGREDPHTYCMPPNFPRAWTLPQHTRIVQTPGMMVMLHEFNGAYLGSLDSPDVTYLFRTMGRIQYAPPGYLLFPRGDSLLAQPFDETGLRLDGDATPIAEDVSLGAGMAAVQRAVAELNLNPYTRQLVAGTYGRGAWAMSDNATPKPALTVRVSHPDQPVGPNGLITYTITVKNDGNAALGPIYLRDLFPPGTEYIGSSDGPSELTPGYANWTLLSLGIGGSSTIDLKLNVTEDVGSLVNRVEAAGCHDGQWVTAADLAREGIEKGLKEFGL